MEQADNNIFDHAALAYDDWFNRHAMLFRNEQKAIAAAIPTTGLGIEIGAGSGRFTQALGISIGVEPAASMARLALNRGVPVINALAISLPIHDGSFDYAVMINTVCFLDDIPKAFAEVNRILKNKGYFIVAIIDKESQVGKLYEEKKASSPWYKDAHFHSVPEITSFMAEAGLADFVYWQTLFSNEEAMEEPTPGFGKGSFVVIRAQKN